MKRDRAANILMTYLGPQNEENIDDQGFDSIMESTRNFEDFKTFFTEVDEIIGDALIMIIDF